MTDSAARFLGHFDLDVTLRDAALDEHGPPAPDAGEAHR